MEFALPTFVITLREGVEAALVVGIVLAYLQKVNQTKLNNWVFAGIAGGVLISGFVGLVFNWILQTFESPNLSPIFKPLLEGVFSLVAIAMLSWMLIWMTQQGKLMKGQVENSLAQTLNQDNQDQGAGWGIFSLILFAVLREGFEIVIFISAKFQEGALPVLGALAGLVASVAIGVGLFKFSIKINIRAFFQVMGVFLILIVSGLVISTLGHLDDALRIFAQSGSQDTLCIYYDHFAQELGQVRSCALGGLVWNLSGILPQRQFPGLLLRALFGYTEKLYLVQAIAYLGFLFSISTFYLKSLEDPKDLALKSK